jgi:hypothetical protein
MAVEGHEEHPPARVLQMSARPSWAWGDGSTAAPPPAAAPGPAPVASDERPAWSWATPPPAVLAAAPPPYLVERTPTRPGPLTRALARARAGVAGVTPVDRTAARVQRVLVMALLAGGWALSLSSPGFEVALPLVAVVLLAATAHPSLSVPRWISARVLPAARLAGPWLTAEDPAPYRVGEAATGLVLVLASLCATVGSPVAAWTLGWAVIAVALVEFTFDVSVVVVVHARLRRARLLRT